MLILITLMFFKKKKEMPISSSFITNANNDISVSIFKFILSIGTADRK